MSIWLEGPFYSDPGVLAMQSEQHDVHYNLRGTVDPAEVRPYLRSNLPGTFDGMFLDQVQYEHKGAGVWPVKATYKTRDPLRIRGTTKGGSSKRLQSIATRRYSKNAEGTTVLNAASAPNFKGAINVQNGSVQGVDVPVPAYTFNMQFKKDALTAPSNLIQSLYNITGDVNSETMTFIYRGQVLAFDEQELRFDGVDWEIDQTNLLSLDLAFSASKTALSFAVGDLTVDKLGWEFLWVYYREQVSATSLIPQPTAVYVEQVFRISNFSIIATL